MTRSLNLGTHVHVYVHALVSGTMLGSSCTTLAVSQTNRYNSWAHAWWCTMPISCPHFHILHACSDSPLPTCRCFGPLAGWLCSCHGHLAGAQGRGWGAAGACLSPACCCAATNIRRVTHRGKKQTSVSSTSQPETYLALFLSSMADASDGLLLVFCCWLVKIVKSLS